MDLLTNMTTLAVGQPYIPGRHSWPEAYEFNYYQGGLELRLFFKGTQKSEKLAVKKGKVALHFLYEPPVIYVTFQFKKQGQELNGICNYTIHKIPPAYQVIPDPLPGHLMLWIHLVEATTGILQANRMVSVPFGELVAAIQDQARQPFDGQAYDAAVKEYLAQYDDVNRIVWNMVRDDRSVCLKGF
jgi:hypothetical protein